MYTKKNNSTNKFLEHRDDLYCQYCGKQCKNLNSLKQHECRCKLNPNKIKDTLSNIGWSKGLTKNTDDRIAKLSTSMKKYHENHSAAFTGHHHTDETKKKLSDLQLKYDHSSNARHSWAKMGYYDGIWMMSSWDLADYIYMKDLGSKIERCTKRYTYIYEGKEHNYTPDFIVDGKIIEIKGYETPKDYAKYEAVDNLKVLYHKDIKPMIKYVINKYNVSSLDELYAR